MKRVFAQGNLKWTELEKGKGFMYYKELKHKSAKPGSRIECRGTFYERILVKRTTEENV